MDSGILSYLQDDRGWLFWAGAAAMAAGASLLLAVAVWNGLRTVRRLRSSPRGRTSPARAEYGGMAWRKTASAPATMAPAPRVEAAEAGRAEGLAAMLRRLRGAADQLEEMAERTPAGRLPDGESDLKALGCDVEYVFRASGP